MSSTHSQPLPINPTMASPMPLSLYIPRVHASLDEKNVRQIFERLALGELKRVDLIIPGMKHDPHQEIEEDITALPDPLPLFNLCFIHYSSWNHGNETARRFYEDVFVQEKEARVQYDNAGHFFKIFKNKNPKPDEQYELEQAFKKQQALIQLLKKKCELYDVIIQANGEALLNQEYRYDGTTSIVQQNGDVYEVALRSFT